MKVETKPKVDHTPAELGVEAKILLRAAVLIEIDGWCGHMPKNMQGPHCIASAVIKAASESKLDHHDAYLKLGYIDGLPPSTWNDRPGRTKDEVVSRLRSIALGL